MEHVASPDVALREAAGCDELPEKEVAGRPYGVLLLPWANHGFDFNPTGTSSQRVKPYVDAFLRRFLRRAAGLFAINAGEKCN